MTPDELERQLRRFQPNQTRYQHHHLLAHSPGLQFLVEEAEAQWIVCAIAHEQTQTGIARLQLQCWRLNNGPIPTLSCFRDNLSDNAVFRTSIRKTAFPLPELQLFVSDGCLMLPSEYNAP